MSDLVVLSPCFYPDESTGALTVESARKQGLDIRLYGVGEIFLPHGADAQIARLYSLMSAEKIAEHVLVTDCRDVLFLAGAGEILEKFAGFGKNLVMSTERECWPPENDFMTFHGKDKYGYDYINAGQYIGTWEYTLHCLKHLLDVYRGKTAGADNSQGWWMWAKLRNELDFAMDSGCEIFQSMSGGAAEHVFIEGSRVWNALNRSHPCSVHFNGNPGVVDPHGEMYRRLTA